MVVLAITVGLVISVLMARRSYAEVWPKWRPLYAALQIVFLILIVPLAWYRGAPNDFAYFIAFAATGLLLITVFFLGRASLAHYRERFEPPPSKSQCPVCGYPELAEPPRSEGNASHEICPSCGFEFGFDDDSQGVSYEHYREKWIRDGYPWFFASGGPPAQWDPREQLRSVGIEPN